MQMLAELFLVFFKIGAVTFGGGYAMLPILQKEIVVNKKWGTDKSFWIILPSDNVLRG